MHSLQMWHPDLANRLVISITCVIESGTQLCIRVRESIPGVSTLRLRKAVVVIATKELQFLLHHSLA